MLRRRSALTLTSHRWFGRAVIGRPGLRLPSIAPTRVCVQMAVPLRQSFCTGQGIAMMRPGTNSLMNSRWKRTRVAAPAVLAVNAYCLVRDCSGKEVRLSDRYAVAHHSSRLDRWASSWKPRRRGADDNHCIEVRGAKPTRGGDSAKYHV